MNAVAAAKAVTTMIPNKPKTYLGGIGATAESLNATRYYGAMMSAAVAAWRYAAAMALNDAVAAAPSDWIIDQDNHAFIQGVADLSDLSAMCEPAYAWQGHRADQL